MPKRKSVPAHRAPLFWITLLANLALGITTIRETIHAQSMEQVAKECVATSEECSQYLEACVGALKQEPAKGDGYLR
jgi:hypothetical protein